MFIGGASLKMRKFYRSPTPKVGALPSNVDFRVWLKSVGTGVIDLKRGLLPNENFCLAEEKLTASEVITEAVSKFKLTDSADLRGLSALRGLSLI